MADAAGPCGCSCGCCCSCCCCCCCSGGGSSCALLLLRSCCVGSTLILLIHGHAHANEQHAWEHAHTKSASRGLPAYRPRLLNNDSQKTINDRRHGHTKQARGGCRACDKQEACAAAQARQISARAAHDVAMRAGCVRCLQRGRQRWQADIHHLLLWWRGGLDRWRFHG